MKEYGGYNLILDKYFEFKNQEFFKSNNYTFSLARHSLIPIIKSFKPTRIHLPYYTCESIKNLAKHLDVKVNYYNINELLLPDNIKVKENDLLILNNYFGLFDCNFHFKEYLKKYDYNQIVIDNTHSLSYKNIFTDNINFISPRKFLPVTDGGILYDHLSLIKKKYLPKNIDYSWERSMWLFKGFDEGSRNISYKEYKSYRKKLQTIPYTRMSRMTYQIIKQINIRSFIKTKRKYFYKILDHIQISPLFKDFNFSERTMPIGFPINVSDNYIVQKILAKNSIYSVIYWPETTDFDYNTFESKIRKQTLFIPLSTAENPKLILNLIKKYILNDN